MPNHELHAFARSAVSAAFLTPDDLARQGLSRHRVSCLVASGHLLRLRNGRYVPANMPQPVVEAGRLGGRLDCVSLLSMLGVFVRERSSLHLQFAPGTTRLPARPDGVVAHWRETERERVALTTDLVGALVQACRCQSPRDAVATLDSAWHHGLIGEAEVSEIFGRLPRRYHALRAVLDPRAESGAETLMRLLLRALGSHIDVQKNLEGVGRVDLIVDRWLIVECDSKAYHEGWAAQSRDRRRDIAAAALGFTTIRPMAEDIYYRADEVLAAMKAVLAAGRGRAFGMQNSTDQTPQRRPRAR